MTVTRLTIDLDALARNYAALRDMAGCEAAPAIKADGYGVGGLEAGLRLWREGARGFHVARLSEGEALRGALGHRDATIYVLDGPTAGTGDRLRAAGLTPVINSLDQAASWDGPAAIHVDTGMNRLGLTLAQAATLIGRPDVLLVMSHLACAGQPDHPMNAIQLARFHEARALFPAAPASLASSGGIFLGRDYAFDQVRPGISLFGGGPHDRPDGASPRWRPWRRRSCRCGPYRPARPSAMAAPLPPSGTWTWPSWPPATPTGCPGPPIPGARSRFAGARRRMVGRVSMITDCP